VVVIVKILKGETVQTAQPVIVTTSAAVIEAVAVALLDELRGTEDGPRVLELLTQDGTEPPPADGGKRGA